MVLTFIYQWLKPSVQTYPITNNQNLIDLCRNKIFEKRQFKSYIRVDLLKIFYQDEYFNCDRLR